MIAATRPGAATPTRLYPSTTTTYSRGIDYIAVEHAMNGEEAPLTTAERVEAARQLHKRGIKQAEISRRLNRDRATIASWQNNNWTRPRLLSTRSPSTSAGPPMAGPATQRAAGAATAGPGPPPTHGSGAQQRLRREGHLA